MTTLHRRLAASLGLNAESRSQRGIVGVNLVLVIAFALYAVIMLSRTTLAAKQIDDRVRVIVTEVGPGSNVSRLDETQKLNTIGQTAEDILRAAQPLSGQAQVIIDTAKSIDNTVSAIQANANEINAVVHSINSTASSLLPVVQTIHTHVNSINCALTSPSATLLGVVGSLLNVVLGSVEGAVGCNT